MTPQDLITLIEQSPELQRTIRSYALTSELLELPARFDRFQSETKEEFRKVHQRLDALERGQQELRQGQEELRQEIQKLQQGYEELRQGQQEMRQEIHEIRQDQQEMRQIIQELQQGYRMMNNNLARAMGPAYERHVRYKIPPRCIGAFGMENPTIAFSGLDGPTPQFNRMIARALRDNAITQEQNESLTDADFIISADGNHYAAVEATVTAEDQDIIRAADRAAILSQATGGTARAVVVADTIHPSQLNLAGAMNVTIFRIEF